eukprot:m51a1_g8145 hypothetical protein (827) ;mRNA; r:33284-36651
MAPRSRWWRPLSLRWKTGIAVTALALTFDAAAILCMVLIMRTVSRMEREMAVDDLSRVVGSVVTALRDINILLSQYARMDSATQAMLDLAAHDGASQVFDEWWTSSLFTYTNGSMCLLPTVDLIVLYDTAKTLRRLYAFRELDGGCLVSVRDDKYAQAVNFFSLPQVAAGLPNFSVVLDVPDYYPMLVVAQRIQSADSAGTGAHLEGGSMLWGSRLSHTIQPMADAGPDCVAVWGDEGALETGLKYDGPLPKFGQPWPGPYAVDVVSQSEAGRTRGTATISACPRAETTSFSDTKWSTEVTARFPGILGTNGPLLRIYRPRDLWVNSVITCAVTAGAMITWITLVAALMGLWVEHRVLQRIQAISAALINAAAEWNRSADDEEPPARPESTFDGDDIAFLRRQVEKRLVNITGRLTVTLSLLEKQRRVNERLRNALSLLNVCCCPLRPPLIRVNLPGSVRLELSEILARPLAVQLLQCFCAQRGGDSIVTLRFLLDVACLEDFQRVRAPAHCHEARDAIVDDYFGLWGTGAFMVAPEAFTQANRGHLSSAKGEAWRSIETKVLPRFSQSVLLPMLLALCETEAGGNKRLPRWARRVLRRKVLVMADLGMAPDSPPPGEDYDPPPRMFRPIKRGPSVRALVLAWGGLAAGLLAASVRVPVLVLSLLPREDLANAALVSRAWRDAARVVAPARSQAGQCPPLLGLLSLWCHLALVVFALPHRSHLASAATAAALAATLCLGKMPYDVPLIAGWVASSLMACRCAAGGFPFPLLACCCLQVFSILAKLRMGRRIDPCDGIILAKLSGCAIILAALVALLPQAAWSTSAR